MSQPLIIANWKMHKTLQEATAYVRELASLTSGMDDVDVIVAPAFTALAAAAEIARNTMIGIAAQTIACDPEGAFTGEVSAAMVKDAGADSVIVGHSERRRLFGETDALVNRKWRAARAASLMPILCVGETLEERDAGQMLGVLDRQIKDGLDCVGSDDAEDMVIAYEPVWAIGTGRNATSEEAEEAHRHIRSRVRQWFSATAAENCRVLYGGSVRADNIGELLRLPDVNGALVGGASLDVAKFFEIVCRARPQRRP